MSEFPAALVIGSVMILAGVGVAVWIVISVVRQSQKDRSFPD